MDIDAVVEHPEAVVPVTLYVVVVVGLTVIVELVDPLLHKQVVPGIELPTFIIAEAPSQSDVAVLVTESTGLGFTVTVAEAVPVHPEAVPVTLQVVETEGLTVIEFPIDPLLHTQVVPGTVELTDNVAFSPLQMVAEFIDKTGIGFTKMVTESSLQQRGANEMSSKAKSFPAAMVF